MQLISQFSKKIDLDTSVEYYEDDLLFMYSMDRTRNPKDRPEDPLKTLSFSNAKL